MIFSPCSFSKSLLYYYKKKTINTTSISSINEQSPVDDDGAMVVVEGGRLLLLVLNIYCFLFLFIGSGRLLLLTLVVVVQSMWKKTAIRKKKQSLPAGHRMKNKPWSYKTVKKTMVLTCILKECKLLHFHGFKKTMVLRNHGFSRS